MPRPDSCPHRVALTVERRPANALCVEVGTPLPRCKLKPPVHWGSGPSVTRWLLSGGSPLVLGHCNASCPLKVACPPAGSSGTVAIVEAITSDRIVHVEHPDFGGWLTAGKSTRADGSRFYEVIHHGGTCDVGYDEPDLSESAAYSVARYVEFQVGNRRAYWAARAAIEKS